MHTNQFGRCAQRTAAILLLLGATACDRVGSNQTVSVVGERSALLVWHPVKGATHYRSEILDLQGRVIHDHQTADTLSPLPPLFQPDSGTQWRVRAFNGDKEIGASARQPII